MMKLEEVGKVPEDRIAIQRMVVSTCPSSLFYQLSFCQHLLQFFLNRFLGTFRDFTNDDDSFEKDIKGVKSSDRSSDSFSSNSELFDEVEFSSEEMCENGSHECSWVRRSQSHVSDLFILDFIIIIVLLKLCFLSASFIPCSLLAIHALSVISRV